MEIINEVMVIDDDPIFVFLAKSLIKISNKAEKVSIYEEGMEAFKELEGRVQNNLALPDIIFLDIAMPVWDAWNFLDEFSKLSLTKSPLIYILSSSAHRDDKNKASKFGLAGRYIEKPLSLEILNKVFIDFLQSNA